jgi:alpha-L-fucosidase
MKFHGLSLALSLCLSAGSGMAQMVYQPTVASFSSQNPYGIDRAASRTRDSSGLASGVSGIAGGADATHSRTVNGNMWTTRGITAAPDDTNPAITYDLGAVTNLQTIRLWNYNEFDLGVSYTKFGAKDIRVSTSPDNLTFTTLGDIQLAQGGATTAEPAQDFTAAVTAIRYVRFQILSNWDGASFWSPLNGPNSSGADGRFLVGLSEVRFVGVPTPPPAAAVSNPSPANAATAIQPGVALAWDTNNGEGSATGYRVIVGVGDPLYNYEVETANLAPFASSRMTWQPPANIIQKGSLFWWRVEKSTVAGTVAGPTWTFTTRPETAAEKDARMAWFRNDKLFGAIVWGLYSGAEGVWPPVTGSKNPSWTYAEWMQFWANLSTLNYRDALEPYLTGTNFNATRMAQLCKQAGMSMVYVMPRHHDGYALWNTQTSTLLAPNGFKIANSASNPSKRDYLKELVDALRAEGIRVGFYFSLGDWHHPDFPHSGIPWAHPRPGEASPPGHTEVWENYVTYLHQQVKEIVAPGAETGTNTNYGPFDVVYFDYSSSGINGEQWGATKLVHLVRRYNPDIIINNRLWNGLDNPNGDYATPEANIDNVGYNEYDRDWEAIMSANDPPTWGFGRPDLYPFKSPRDLVWDIVDVASKNGTIELSVSPMADGSLHPEQLSQYAGLGAWMDANGASIRGTTGNPVGSRPAWGEYTSKRAANRLYLHVFNRPADGNIIANGLAGTVSGARLLAQPAQPLTVTPVTGGFQVHLPANLTDPINTVIEVDYVFPRTVAIAAVSSENVLGLDRDASRTVDGSGMTGGNHADGETGVAWTTVGNLGPGSDLSPSITFDLGETVDVESIREWGYNTSFVTGGGTPMSRIGPKDVDVFTSADGVTFTFAESLVFAQASGTAGYAGHLIPVDYQNVRYIRLNIKTNHDGAVFDGTGNQPGGDGRSLTGLSEIQFGIASDPAAPPEVVSSGFNGAAFRVTARGFDPARKYRMTRSANLSDAFATIVDGPRLPAAGTDDFVDPAPPPGSAFYRIEASP